MTGPRLNLIPWLLGALLLVLAAAAWVWFERNFERRTLDVPTGWSNAAKRNPFLAAERFLQRVGVEVESAPGRALLRDLPAPGDMLVVNGMDVLSTKRREHLHQWLEDGGHLLLEATQVLPPGETPRANDFLAGIGTLLRANADVDDGEAIAEIDFVAYPEPVKVGFNAGYFLEDAAQQSIASAQADGRPRLLQYRIGDGLLTVTSDNSFLTNGDIARHDHALALALLSADVNKVWLLYDPAAPGLGTLLWGAAPQALIAGILLLMALLWHLGGTIGPLLSTPARARRDLAHHLEAAAALMWRQGRGGLLMEATGKRIETAWLRRHPLLRDMQPATRARWISEQLGAGTSAGQVYASLYQRHHSAQDFMAQSRLLQRLWSAL